MPTDITELQRLLDAHIAANQRWLDDPTRQHKLDADDAWHAIRSATDAALPAMLAELEAARNVYEHACCVRDAHGEWDDMPGLALALAAYDEATMGADWCKAAQQEADDVE